MIHGTWSERSTQTIAELTIMVNKFLTENDLTKYEVKHRMSGLNDALAIRDTTKDPEGDHMIISVIIGWMNADMELAIVHHFSSGNSWLETKKHLEVDNSKVEIPADRRSYELVDNRVKYYECPFTDRINDVYEDIVTAIKIIEGGN